MSDSVPLDEIELKRQAESGNKHSHTHHGAPAIETTADVQPPATIREAEGEEDEFIKALGRNKSREASNASLSAAAAATAAAAAASNESDDNQRHESVVSFDEQVELKRPAADAPPVALSDEKTEVYPTNDHDDDDDNDGGDLRRSEEVPDDHNELAISEKHAEHAANESSDPQPAAAIQHHDEHETVKEHETHDRHSDDDSRHTHETHEEKREHEHHKTAAIQHAGENDEQRPHQHHDAHSDDANEAPVALETTHDTEAVAAKQHSPSPPPPQQHQDEDKKHEISAIAGDTKREATPSPPPPAHTHVEAHEEHEEQQEARPTEIAAGEHVESSSSRSEGQHEAAAAFHHHDQQEKDAVDEAAAESRAKTLNDYTSTTIIESEQRSPTPPTDVVGPRRIHDDDSFAAAISHLPRAASDARPPSPSSGAVTVDKASETALLEEIRDSKHVELQPANEAQSSAPLEAASTRSVAGSDDYKEQSIETNASKPTDERAIEATNAQKKHEPADDADATAAAAKTTAHATPAIVADNAAAVAAESGAPLLPTSNAAPIASGSKTTTADERQTTVAAVSTSKIEETSEIAATKRDSPQSDAPKSGRATSRRSESVVQTVRRRCTIL